MKISFSEKAFTLIELLVVIAIVGILSGLIMISMNGATDVAKDSRRKSDIGQIKKALITIYNFNNMTYPIQTTKCNIGDSGASGCATLNSALAEYFSTIPNDPNGSYYTYQSSTNGKSYTLSYTLSTGESSNYSSISGNSTTTCGENVIFTYNGTSVTYGTVVSQAGKCWLDRNLGASQVATAYNDTLSYGDLFQWGRLVDGHQIRTSTTTTTLSTTDTPGNSNFILITTTPYDWRSPANTALWQGVSGTNNPCPSGFRLPTTSDWYAEMAAGSWTSNDSTFASPLKLPRGGLRNYGTGSFSNLGTYGYYWCSAYTGNNSYYFYSNSTLVAVATTYRSFGMSVRCIKD